MARFYTSCPTERRIPGDCEKPGNGYGAALLQDNEGYCFQTAERTLFLGREYGMNGTEKGARRRMRLQELAVPLAVASVFAALLAASIPLANPKAPNWVDTSSPFTALNIAFAWIAAFAFMWLLSADDAPKRLAQALRRIRPHAPASNPSQNKAREGNGSTFFRRIRSKLAFSWDYRSILVCALLILVAWFPVLLFIWPGGFSRDTVNMLYQFTTSGPVWYSATGTMIDAHFINHHPVFDTLICGFFYWLGSLTGNSAWGIFFFACATYLFAAGVLGAMLCYLHSKLHLAWGFSFACLLFFMFFPVFPLFFSYLSKDAIFVPWFLLWALEFVELWRTRGKALTVRFAILFCLVSAVCILSKQTALYLVLAGAVALFARMRGKRLKLACAGLAGGSLLVALALFPALVYPALGGVAPVGQQEALGTPLNQTVSLYREHPETFSSQDRETMNRVIKLDKAVRDYREFTVDGVKDRWRTNTATPRETMAFLALWASKGLTPQGARCYFESTARICSPFFVPTAGLNAPNFLSPRKIRSFASSVDRAGGDFVDLHLKQPKVFEENRKNLDGAIAQAVRTPVAGMFLTIGLYSGFIPLMCLIALSARRKDAARGAVWAMLPVIVLLLIQIVTPAAFARYAMPFVAGTPLLIGCTWALLNGGRADASQAEAGGKAAARAKDPHPGAHAATPPFPACRPLPPLPKMSSDSA